MDTHYEPLFTLRIGLYRPEYDKRLIIIRAFERTPTVYEAWRPTIALEVRHAGRVVFPIGQLYFGVGMGQSIDDVAAKRSAISSVALRPGDTDAEFFDSYSPDQLDFVQTHGESLGLVAEERYGND